MESLDHKIVADVVAATSNLYVAQPDSLATLALLGGFVEQKRRTSPYSWSEHRKWVILNSNKHDKVRRKVSTGWQYQVYVVNTTYAETDMFEHSYVCRRLMPFGDKNSIQLFHMGFICAGHPSDPYSVTFRPEDMNTKSTDQMNKELFGAKLYFFDKNRSILNGHHNAAADITLIARVRQEEVIGFYSIVRTNAHPTSGMGASTSCDKSRRGYEKEMGDWSVQLQRVDCFEVSGGSREKLASEVEYHNSIHLLIYQMITKVLG